MVSPLKSVRVGVNCTTIYVFGYKKKIDKYIDFLRGLRYCGKVELSWLVGQSLSAKTSRIGMIRLFEPSCVYSAVTTPFRHGLVSDNKIQTKRGQAVIFSIFFVSDSSI